MEVLVTKVDAVRDHGENLTIVTVGDHEVVANKQEDGSPRWTASEPVIYVPEGAIIPDDVLQERGYWDDEKNRGLLEGNKKNRVKMRRFAGVESRGLLFKVSDGYAIRGNSKIEVTQGSDVSEFLGIVEHKV